MALLYVVFEHVAVTLPPRFHGVVGRFVLHVQPVWFYRFEDLLFQCLTNQREAANLFFVSQLVSKWGGGGRVFFHLVE